MLDSKVDDSSRTSCVGFCLWLSPWCEMMRILGIFEDRGASPGQPSCNWLVCSSSCCRACSSELLSATPIFLLQHATRISPAFFDKSQCLPDSLPPFFSTALFLLLERSCFRFKSWYLFFPPGWLGNTSYLHRLHISAQKQLLPPPPPVI